VTKAYYNLNILNYANSKCEVMSRNRLWGRRQLICFYIQSAPILIDDPERLRQESPGEGFDGVPRLRVGHCPIPLRMLFGVVFSYSEVVEAEMKYRFVVALLSGTLSAGVVSEAVALPAAERMAQQIISEGVGRSYLALPIPRSDFGPGTVLTARTRNGVFTAESIVCRRALKAGFDPGPPADLSIVEVEIDDDVDITFSLKLLNRVLGPSNSAEIGSTGIQFKNTVNITWSDIQERYYTRDEITPARLNPDCLRAIQRLTNSERRRLYVIERAVAVAGFKYEQIPDNNGQVGGGVNWSEALSAKAGVNWKLTGERSLSISSPRYLLITAPKFMNWQRSGQTSARELRYTFALSRQPPGPSIVAFAASLSPDPQD
jgi:hypothetical protein